MAKPRDLVVRWVSDVRGFLRGTDEVERALEEQIKDLRTVDTTGTRTADSLADAYQRAGQRIRADAKRTGKTTRTEFADAGKEAGDEFAQNLGESISSGDISGLLSGTVGGLVGTFGKGGPVALALGAATAVGIAGFTKLQESAQKAADAAQTAFDELLDNATKETRFRNRLESLFGTYEEGLRQITRLSDTTGVSVQEIADALAYGGQPAKDLADEMERAEDAALRLRMNRARATQTKAEIDAARELADLANKSADAAERARDAERARARALSDSRSAIAGLYSIAGSSYAQGGSAYASQVPKGRVP